MKQKIIYALFATVLCILFACKSKEQKGKDVMKEIAENSIKNQFKGSMSYKINDSLVIVTQPTALISPDDGKQYFGGETDANLLNIIFPKVLAQGETNTNCSANFLNKEPMAVYTNVLSNTVTISKKTDKLVAGTFAFEINYSAGNKKVMKITEGKFEVENLGKIIIPQL